MDSNASSQALANEALAPSLISSAIESFVSGPKSTKSTHPRQSGVNKIEDVHRSVDNLKQIRDVLRALQNSLSENIDSQLKQLQVDCLQWTIDQLSTECKQISKSVDHTKEKKQSQQAHAKLTKEQRQEAAQRMAIAKKQSASSTVHDILLNVWNAAKRAIFRAPTKEADSSSPKAKKPRTQNVQRPPLAAIDSNANTENDAASSNKSASIQLPLPADRVSNMYTPAETVEVYLKMDAEKEIICGQNRSKQRSYMGRVKTRMLELHLPIKKSRFYEFLDRHAGPGQPAPPKFWSQTGRPEIASVGELEKAHDDHQAERFGRGWGRKETEDFLYEKKKRTAVEKGIDPTSVEAPSKPTVNAYHSALESMPGKSRAAAKPKPLHRDIAETSERSLLSNAAAIVMSRTQVLRPNQIPAKYRFDESKATPGVLLARNLAAKARGVPKDMIQFTPYPLVSNVDDKACIYDRHQGDGTGQGKNDEACYVIVNENVMNQGYDIHDGRDSTKDFNGLKVRYTNLIFAGGNLGTLFIQILGFTAEELPNAKNGVHLVPIEGLTPDGNLNPNAKAIGYVALVRGGQDAETEMFRQYEEYVRKPSVDAIKLRLGADLDDIQPWCRAVHTFDGGVPQMKAMKEKMTLDKCVSRNETFIKYSKNTSSTMQPCDVGDGHMRQGHHTKTLDSKYIPHHGCANNCKEAFMGLRNSGDLVATADRFDLMVSATSRYPTICRYSYTEKSLENSFVKMGMLDENHQGVDLIVLFNTFKGPRPQKTADKWIVDFPELCQDFEANGRILESTFDRLGYPLDTDSSGNVYPLPESSLATQTHRQRALQINHREMLPVLARASTEMIAATESSEAAIAQEENWRLTLLKKNTEMEELLHQINGNDPKSEPDLLCTYDFPFDSPRIRKRGLPIEQFVRCRTMTSSKDKSFKPPARIGKVEKVKEILERLKANPDSQVTPEEDCWLYRFYLCFNDPLTLCVIVPSSPAESSRVPAAPSVQTHIVTPSHMPRLPANVDFAIIGDQGLLEEARQRIISSTINPENTSLVKSRIHALYPKILKRYSHFKQYGIPNTAELQHHWVLSGYDINITRCLEIIGIVGHIMNNPETALIGDSLLRPKGVGSYLSYDDERCKDMHGLGLRHDNQRARFVSTAVVDGNNKSFQKQHADDRSKSKDLSTELGRTYPLTKPHNSERGGWRGQFDDLKLCAAIVIDPSKGGDGDCLSRDGGLFVWGDVTLNKLKDCTVSGADSLCAKRIRLALSMIEFTYVLMMSQNDHSAYTPFKSFMGRALNLQQSREQRD